MVLPPPPPATTVVEEVEGSVAVDQENVGSTASSVSYWPDLRLPS